jgi:hypothetical protein
MIFASTDDGALARHAPDEQLCRANAKRLNVGFGSMLSKKA